MMHLISDIVARVLDALAGAVLQSVVAWAARMVVGGA